MLGNWQLATSARYDEFDTAESVQFQSDAAADSGKLGNSIVYLTNSVGGLRAIMKATKSKLNNIKGIVLTRALDTSSPTTRYYTWHGRLRTFRGPT